jgi:hypothetical protein
VMLMSVGSALHGMPSGAASTHPGIAMQNVSVNVAANRTGSRPPLLAMKRCVTAVSLIVNRERGRLRLRRRGRRSHRAGKEHKTYKANESHGADAQDRSSLSLPDLISESE